MRPSHTVWALLCVVLASSLVAARPSPEAEADAGYSYNPPPAGLRLNYQPPWRSPVAAESRSHASEVTVEQVPIRLVQHSRELPPPAHSTSNQRGAYYFPSSSARLQQEQHNQQYYRSPEQANQEQNKQQNRAAYYFTSEGQQQQQQQQQQSQQQNNVASHQQYRPNTAPQQSGAYSQQSGNVNNNYSQYQRQQQFQNQQHQYQQPQQDQQQTQQNQYQPQQARSIGNNNQGQIVSGSGYQYNAANNGNNNNGNHGYQYSTPATEVPQEEEVTTEATVTSSTSTELPRITIAISKSTVIHTGKGSYQLDEKTGKPKPIIAEAHSYAGVPEPTKKPETGDALSGEGTGNFPIITKGTPPEDEEEEEDTEANTEQPTTTPANVDDPTNPPPTAQAPVSLYSNSWPYQQYGHHAHVIVAPGQTQYFALGTSAPMSQYYAPTASSQYFTAVQPSQYLQPAATQYVPQPLAYAHQYGAYHPSVFARLNNNIYQKSSLKWPFANYFPIVIRDPFVSMYGALSQVLEYGPEADICRGKTVTPTEAAPVENPTEPPADSRASEQDEDSLQQPADQVHDRTHRMVIYKGGIAIAGPGGTADAGRGGTAIVGPGGTAYSSPNGISVVGPGGKVVLQGANSETVLAKGPIIYYHKA